MKDAGIVVGLLLNAMSIVLLCHPTTVACNISAFRKCIIGHNMVLYMNDNHIMY